MLSCPSLPIIQSVLGIASEVPRPYLTFDVDIIGALGMDLFSFDTGRELEGISISQRNMGSKFSMPYRECVDDSLLCVRMNALGALTVLSGVPILSGRADCEFLETTNLRKRDPLQIIVRCQLYEKFNIN